MIVVNVASTASNVGFAGNVSDVDFSQQATHADINVGVSSVFVSGVQADGRAERPDVHTDQSGVHTVTDRAYDVEVFSYYQDGDSSPTPRPPSAFHYPTSPRATLPFVSVYSQADSRQSQISHRSVIQLPRAASRQSVHSRASGRLSTHSQPTDPFIELMRGVFDNQRADVAAQRADAGRREQKMEREIERRGREAMEKACLWMELAQLKKDIAAKKRQTTTQLFSPAAAQLDVHTDSLTFLTAGTLSGNIQSTAAISAPDYSERAMVTDSAEMRSTLPLQQTDSECAAPLAPELMISDSHPPANVPVEMKSADYVLLQQQTDSDRATLPVPGTIDRAYRPSTDSFGVENRQVTENNSDVNNVLINGRLRLSPTERIAVHCRL